MMRPKRKSKFRENLGDFLLLVFILIVLFISWVTDSIKGFFKWIKNSINSAINLFR